ncbi:MAG: repressor LexA [Verrucomicrobia bacterium]|nr:repressor LexA [Verrucomicrobiota bacterium]
MSNDLTHHQRVVLEYLTDHRRRLGIMPSTRDIQKALGFASQTSVVRALAALEKKGAIKRASGAARGIAVLWEDLGKNLLELPLLGRIPAGMADDTEGGGVEGWVTIDRELLGLKRRTGRYFALRVRGDSMINAHIEHGDVVVCESTETCTPRPNDIVAALIDGESTLKRYIVESGRPFLRAENPDYPDLLPLRELTIQGVSCGVIRRYATA